MDFELNSNGELKQNTMILDDGSVIFIDEHRMSERERTSLDCSIKFFDYIENKYKTTDIFELMDRNITRSEMFTFLCSARQMKKHGLLEEE